MAEKLFDDSEFYMKRFSCACLHPCHTVDFSIEIINPETTEAKCQHIGIDFSETYSGMVGVLWGRWGRLMIALRYLFRGKIIWGHGFLLRVEDIDDMIELLHKAKG